MKPYNIPACNYQSYDNWYYYFKGFHFLMIDKAINIKTKDPAAYGLAPTKEFSAKQVIVAMKDRKRPPQISTVLFITTPS